MSGLMDELTAIKAVEDKITANKVANFAYTDTAYNDPATYADGVQTYDPDGEQNIPVANASTLKVNATILTKGWRAQASAITRMLMNHFLGRCSYNLNKVNDLFSLLLTKLMAYLGQPNGIATLDGNGRLPQAVGSDKVFMTRRFFGAVFGRLLARVWAQVTGDTSAYTFNTIYYANGLWVAGSSSHGLWWSEDKETWTQVTGDTSAYTFNTIYYANSLWVAGSNVYGCWWSEYGKTWTRGDTGGQNITVTDVCYANGLWVAGSKLLAPANYKTVWYSVDGKSWTQCSTDVPSMGDVYAIHYAEGIWIGACSNNILKSEDGMSWSSAYSSNSYSIYYANGIWVAVGNNGVFWSDDTDTWNNVASTVGYSFATVYYANGLWLAGSNQNGLWYSLDGKNWAQISGTTSTYTFNAILYKNGR